MIVSMLERMLDGHLVVGAQCLQEPFEMVLRGAFLGGCSWGVWPCARLLRRGCHHDDACLSFSSS
jgi:hypothetical protein